MRMAPLLLAAAAFLVVVLVSAGWLGRGRGERPETDPARVLADLRAREARERAALRERYPLGYAVFAVAGTQLYRVDGPEPPGHRPRVDWSRTELPSSIRTSVILRPPDATTHDGGTLVATPVRLPRIAGYQTRYLLGAGIEGTAEVLRADWTGFTCVLGLRPEVGGRRG